MALESEQFRNYVDSAYQRRVEHLYQEKYTNQTVEYGKKRLSEYTTFNHAKMTLWEAAMLLNDIVDESDPDTNLPQIMHALQTAEACRLAWPEADWFHLLGFIHDLGKILAHESMGGLCQWEMVGDTFPLGCRLAEENVLCHLGTKCPDANDPRYNTNLGMYAEGCGFSNVIWAFGHDEYLYHVLKNHKECRLPDEALYIIRHHSFYPWHNRGGYKYLENEFDTAMLPLVQKFQKCDLYSKVDSHLLDLETLKPYYQFLIEKYIPGIIFW
jgi:inositol oxygenase